MLWIKAFHIAFVIFWFAGIFYLPRLFVYHSMATDQVGIERFKVMERKLYRGIMTPAAVVAVLLGLWLLVLQWDAFAHAGWMHAKLALVLALIAYHLYCGRLLAAFARDANAKSHRFFRWMNDGPPIAILFGILILVVVKPF
ncbi:MAG TPA: CopD family protein [Pseudomonadales bacterium]|nr:CopD family protein [Pseudomonadales bacterium]